MESSAGSRSFAYPTYRNSPLEARSDADAKVEHAYRDTWLTQCRRVASRLNRNFVSD
ncbi:hypothetical protein CBM2598_U10078 [Cupriavidus taiwanensis]|uniref:Uncharacterized protein n=1 Tax=Cupriavidus taiwanensis TaxID=164546 RepID=A0A7Z7JFS1_9BURK|nr:hypothetical protein CBM2597_U10272 [Cupriavidus taiwanensis]SOZ96257.1 hypothetical protein CBM2598_U10078 [Cupriavidus taiwanensis]SPC25777.1 hypothetical protein CBM2594_U10278 [Cupriavidus taiwanensis]